MQINQSCINFIKKHEGVIDHIYMDHVGFLTIGCGHLCQENDFYLKNFSLKEAKQLLINDKLYARALFKISKRETDFLLGVDLQKSASSIFKLIKAPISQNQFTALMSFTFNLGGGALQRSTLRQKLNRLDYTGASKEFEKWIYAGGKKSKGLLKRRREERILFLNTP